jgi:kinase
MVVSKYHYLYADRLSQHGEDSRRIRPKLDMSRNQLIGEIPAELGAMPVLSVLDLSSNELSGAIPPALANLRLTSLNLFSNQLSGQVPAGLATGA